jgi:hypothetical protein
VRFLLEKMPESVQRRNEEGLFPFELAQQARYPCQVEKAAIGALVEAWPASLHSVIADADGSNQRSVDLVRFVIQHGSTYGALGVKDRRGRLPLHVAVSRGEPDNGVVKDLVELYPAALQAVDGSGRLPVHVALSKSACPPLTLIRGLAEPWPGSLQVADGCGLYPLHLVLYKHNLNMEGSRFGDLNRPGDRMHRNFWPVVQYLVQLCPATTSLSDASGRLPLHAAASRGLAAGPELLDFLVRASPPNACLRRDHEGRLPLHHAVVAPRVSWTVVDALVQSCPGSLQVRDRDGYNTIHRAASRRDAPIEVLYRLVRSWPTLLLARE